MGWYAKIMMAPNSDIPLPHIIIEPERMDFFTIGRLTVRNACQGVAPRVMAVFSYRWSTSLNPSFTELIRKGTDTKNMAMEMAIPLDQIRFPEGKESWGFQVVRWIASNRELDIFSPVHHEAPGWISLVCDSL